MLRLWRDVEAGRWRRLCRTNARQGVRANIGEANPLRRGKIKVSAPPGFPISAAAESLALAGIALPRQRI
jgi:hypothetical protein